MLQTGLQTPVNTANRLSLWLQGIYILVNIVRLEKHDIYGFYKSLKMEIQTVLVSDIREKCFPFNWHWAKA